VGATLPGHDEAGRPVGSAAARAGSAVHPRESRSKMTAGQRPFGFC